MMPLRTVAVTDITEMSEGELERDFEEAEGSSPHSVDTEKDRDGDRCSSGSTRGGSGSTRGGSGSTRTGSGSTRGGSGSARTGSGSTRSGSGRSARTGSDTATGGSGSTRAGSGSARSGSGSARTGSGSARSGSGKSTDRPSSSDSLKTSSEHSAQTADDIIKADENQGRKESEKSKNPQPTIWQSFKKAGGELNQDTRRAIRYLGRKLPGRRRSRETKVKEIHILPGEDDDQMWARRMAGSGSAHSRSSGGSDPVS